MTTNHTLLPRALVVFCAILQLITLTISFTAITKHLLNYRIPNEQRLEVRIQILVPIFSISCLSNIIIPKYSQIYLDPIREVYEAFVIYTFFSLLIYLLGGERRVITEASLNNSPTHHFAPIVGKFLGKVDLADPTQFLKVKWGILQYIWFKPVYCVLELLFRLRVLEGKWKIYLTILYNLSVSWSLYNLALFWKCLYDELLPFKPWAKFICVKLIIFASYWQGIIITLLVKTGIPKCEDKPFATYIYQNTLLCLEMVAFAILHYMAFPANEYSIAKIPLGGRMPYSFALKDCLSLKDLVWDLKQTLWHGTNYYNYHNFEFSNTLQFVNNRTDNESRLVRLNQGLRFSNNGQDRYWLNEGNYGTTSGLEQEEETWQDDIAGQRFIPEDPNYPVLYNIEEGHKYLRKTVDLRNQIINRYSNNV